MTVNTAVTITADSEAFGISLKYGVNKVKAKNASIAEGQKVERSSEIKTFIFTRLMSPRKSAILTCVNAGNGSPNLTDATHRRTRKSTGYRRRIKKGTQKVAH